MKLINAPSEKFAAAAALFIASEQALAGNGSVGMITHAPFSTSIPVLGGAGLLVLSALLGLVSLRFLKQRHLGGSQFLVVATLAGALAAGGSGIKLINDANADEGILLTDADGGNVNIPFPGENTVLNSTGGTQIITKITLSSGCTLEPTNIADKDGGSSQGDCSDSPGTVLENTDFCRVLVNCDS